MAIQALLNSKMSVSTTVSDHNGAGVVDIKHILNVFYRYSASKVMLTLQPASTLEIKGIKYQHTASLEPP